MANSSPSKSKRDAHPKRDKFIHNLEDKWGKKTVKTFEFLFCVAGIYICYLTFGIFQEKITKSTYGPDDAQFKYTGFLLFIQCFANMMVALFMLTFVQPAPEYPRTFIDKVHHKEVTAEGPPPMYKWLRVSLVYLSAMFGSNHALKFVDYPTQAISKACKPISVLLVSTLWLKKPQKSHKKYTVLIIVTGVALFMLYRTKSPVAAADAASAVQDSSTMDALMSFDFATLYSKLKGSKYAIGLALLSLSLMCDGFTGPLQESIMQGHDSKQFELMFNLNMYSLLWAGIIAIVDNELLPAIELCQLDHSLILDIAKFALSSSMGQVFIFLTLTSFGSLALSLTTTTRKFFTILVSVIRFGHPLNDMQWVAVLVVFAGLGVDIAMNLRSKKAEDEKGGKKA